MAGAIATSCPKCGRKVSVRAELEGKKIRCKECQAVYPVTVAATTGKPASAEKKVNTKQAAGTKSSPTDESNPYGITGTEESHRCPVCANEMDSPEAIICLHCGFNTQTREASRTRRIHDTTGEDRFMWLLPGILCIVAVFVMLIVWLLYHFALPGWIFGDKWQQVLDRPEINGSRNKAAFNELLGEDSWLSILFHYGVEVWVVVGFLFLSFLCIRFAIKRLILHPDPPEREK
jgi:hypothetical protein